MWLVVLCGELGLGGVGDAGTGSGEGGAAGGHIVLLLTTARAARRWSGMGRDTFI